MKTLESIGREAHEINASNGWEVFRPEDWNIERDAAPRLANWSVPDPHYMRADTDCMGNPTPAYWRTFASETANNKNCVIGTGSSAAGAVKDAEQKIIAQGDAYKLCTHMALVHSEVSEATEAIRKRDRANFDEELADVVIRVVSIAYGLGTDLEAEIAAKLAKNRQRGLHHGGKSV